MNGNQAYEIFTRSEIAKDSGSLDGMIKEVVAAFKYALKFDENNLYYSLSSILQFYYYETGDKRRAEIYSDHFAKARFLFNTQVKVRTRFNELVYKLNRTRNPSEKLMRELDSFVDDFEHLLELENAGLSLFIYQPVIIRAYYKNDFLAVEKHCYDAIALFDRKSPSKVQHIFNMMIPGMFISGKADRALNMVYYLKKKYRGTKHTRAVFLYYEVLCLLHTRQYQAAADLLYKSLDKIEMNPVLVEQVALTRGFMQILSNAGLAKTKSRIRMGRLSNELPIFSRDKYGNYINLLIIRIVLSIQQNRTFLIEHYEALKKANQRHSKPASREKAMIRILLRIPAKNFDAEKVRSGSVLDFQSLQQKPMQAESIDIIPWLDLLRIVLDSLRQ